MKSQMIIPIMAILLWSCGGSNQSQEQEAEAPESPVAEAVEEKVDPKVFFKYPEDGAIVGSPVYVEMGVEGMEIEPAGAVKEGFGHHHILINQTHWPLGEVIPMSDTTLHYGKGQTDTSLELEPGEYTLTLQFADGVHASFGEPMAASIKVTVE
ncbi:MAG: DUF4399 domain-containing protein [Bacteroidota bacterium]